MFNGVTSTLPAFQDNKLSFGRILSIGNLRLTSDANSDYILNGQTLSPGGRPVLLSGATYSLGSQASILVINGVTSTLPGYQQNSLPSRPILKLGSLILTADAKSDYVLNGQALSPGGQPIVRSGTTYNLGPQASALVTNGVTSSLPAEQAAISTPEPVIKIGSQYLTADAASRYVFASETLIPNGKPIVVSGTTYSLAPQASALVVNGVKIGLNALERLPTISSKNPSANYELDYIIGSQTIGPGGPAITISGIAISLASLGNTLVIDGSALPFPAKTVPSFIVSSQLITTTAVSHSIARDETLRAAPAVTTPGGNIETASSAPMLITRSSLSPSLATTSDADENAPPGPTSKSGGSRKKLGSVEQLLGLMLGVLALTLL